MVFEKYAQYYDLLYQDKDYGTEAAYILTLINKYHPKTKQILEFLSGTIIHSRQLGDLRYLVTGIEKISVKIQLGLCSIL